jgi:hypothetical protein
MQTNLKEGKAIQSTMHIHRMLRINSSATKQENKKKSAFKYSNLDIAYNAIYSVINMQEDEDAAVRSDVWN